MNNYTSLSKLESLKERYDVLKFNSKVGDETFGSHRRLNQDFYKNDVRWKEVRSKVIIRDNGYELGVKGFPISGPVIVHHITPITEKDILDNSPKLLDPNNLISCSLSMHSAIHYGNDDIFNEIVGARTFNERTSNDTCPWKR